MDQNNTQVESTTKLVRIGTGVIQMTMNVLGDNQSKVNETENVELYRTVPVKQ